MQKIYLIYCLVFYCLLSACAKPVAPTGGDKDVLPPIFVKFSKESPLTNYNGDDIIIQFNEFVTINNVSDITVSPRLDDSPIFKIKGKRLKISLPQSLRDDVTYHINMSGAVKDYTEGNPLDSLHYVLTKSDSLDVSVIKGNIFNTITGFLYDKNCLVSLYPINSAFNDSLVFKQAGFYFAKSSKSKYTLPYIGEGDYELIIIEDSNNNGYFDSDKEMIGFLGNPLTILANDSLQIEDVFLFNPFRETLQVIDVENVSRETAKIKFSKASKDVVVKPISIDSLEYFEYSFTVGSDSLFLYFISNMDTIRFQTFENNMATDTFDVVINNDLFEQNILPVFVENEIQTVEEGGVLQLQFNIPIQSVSQNGFVLREYIDSTSNEISINDINFNKHILKVKAEWILANSYELIITTESIKAFNGTSNFDTLIVPIKVIEPKGIGTAIIKIDTLLNNTNYYLEIVSSQGASKYYERINVETDSIVVDNLHVDSYNLKLVRDDNGNNIWDTGNFFERLQPEKVFIYKDLNIEPNWETEILIKTK